MVVWSRTDFFCFFFWNNYMAIKRCYKGLYNDCKWLNNNKYIHNVYL